ncbi:MAG: insulinase family protein [Treponema sp.]|nr:insulinase family protein [Treponema sp.]
MNLNIGEKIVFSAIFLFLISFTGCKTSDVSGSTKIKTDFIESLEDEPFYKLNQFSFIEKKLSNGIQLVIKKSQNQKDCSLRLVIDSEALSDPKTKSGIEGVTLDLILRGSAEYTDLYVSSLKYTDSAVFMSRVHSDYLELGFTCLASSFENITSVFAKIFKTPLMDTDDFSEIVKEKQIALKDTKTAGERLLDAACAELSSYDRYFFQTDFSADTKLTYQDVVSYQKGLLNARKLRILISGNFTDQEAEHLYTILNAEFGKIPAGSYKKKVPSKNAVDFNSFSEKIKKIPGEEGEKPCALAFYNIPQIAGQDYVKYTLLSMYIDEVLQKELREKQNFVSSAGCGIRAGTVPLGVISIYNIQSEKEGAKNVNQTVNDAIKNSVISEELSKKLDYYKRVYSAIVMSSELSSSKTCDQMAVCSVYCSDAKEYIKRPYYIRRATEQELLSQYNRISESGMFWVVMEF